jgi:nucleoside-diphosphate-sugar epimerase
MLGQALSLANTFTNVTAADRRPRRKNRTFNAMTAAATRSLVFNRTRSRMHVFLAGASGAIGRRLVPLLVGAGHRIVGTTRTERGAGTLRSLGVEPAVVDVLDAAALSQAVTAARPDIVIHQLTGLSALKAGRVEEGVAENAHVRTVGTRNLVDAALAAGVRRMIAQSIAWVYAPGRVPHVESDPLNVAADGTTPVTVQGVVALENAVLKSPPLEPNVLRYGQLYAPGTGR